jgi:FKBP-type peptidyl-prolyl cis-trans isomerase
MALKRQRFFALFFAILFLVTSSSVAVAYIISNIQSSKAADSKTSTTAATTPTASSTSQTKTSTKLAGTKLENFTPVSSVPSLKITDTTVGTGEVVKPGATVTVDYTGAVAATGIIFQSSLDTGQPVTFGLSQVIPGWTEGVPGMKVGGTRRLLIPADLAYGANPPSGSGIPANAPLVFDITLHAITSN